MTTLSSPLPATSGSPAGAPVRTRRVAAVVGFGAMQWADAPDGLVPSPWTWFQGDHGHDGDDDD